MCKNHWSAKYRSKSPGQGTCPVSTARRSSMLGLVGCRSYSWGDMERRRKLCQSHCRAKYRSRYLPSQYIRNKNYARFGSCRPYSWGDIERRHKMCQSHWSMKYRSRSRDQDTCKVSTSRRSTNQGLVVISLIVEEISKVDVKCVNVIGARNIGQEHQIKEPTESIHWEALRKVWLL